MKLPQIFACAGLAVCMASPLGAYAQQSQQPYQAPQAQQQQPGGQRQPLTPKESMLQRRWGHRLNNLNLSDQQRQQVQGLISQYAQSHPAGSPLDRNAFRDLHRQILGVLTSDQQNQYRQQMRALRQQRMQERQQRMQQPQQPQAGAPQQNPPPR